MQPLLLATPGLSPLLLIVVMFGLMYLFMIRPQMKRAKAQAAEREATINALAPGSRVVLTSGLFGTIRHLGERQAVVELAPGVEITVMKQAINKPVTPEEEDFEYEDEAAAADQQAPTDQVVPQADEFFSEPTEQTDLDALPEPTVPGQPDAPRQS